MTKKTDPLADFRKILKLGHRLVNAAEPLVELQRYGEEYEQGLSGEEDPRIQSRQACLVCEGRLVVGEPGSEVNCPNCIVIEPPEGSKCPTCAGKGRVGTKSHSVTCPVCDGTGKR